MKRFLIYLLVLIFSAYALDFILNIAIDKLVIKNSNIRFTRVLKENPDIIVLGNSRGVNSVNEYEWDRLYKSDILNLSYNGMGGKTLKMLVDDLSNTKNTETTFLIEITSFMKWEENNMPYCNKSDNVSDYYKTYMKYFPSLKIHYKEQQNYLQNNFRLLKYNNKLFPKALYYLFKNDKQWVNHRNINSDMIDYYIDLDSIGFCFYSKEFKELIDLIEKRNIKVKFFIAPWFKRYKDKFENYDSIIEKIKSYNIELIDLNDTFPDNNTFFADGFHTNIKGSVHCINELNNFIN